MNAPCERRQGRRCGSAVRLGFPVWLLLSACSPGGSDPVPPDPVRSDPGPAAAAVAPDPPPDRPPRPAGDKETPPDRLTDAAALPVAPAAAAVQPAPAAAPAERPAAPPGPIAAVAVETDPQLAAAFRSRRSLNHILYRDRRYRLLLDEAAARLSRGESLSAFDLLIEVIAADEDVFLWDDVAQRPISARRSGTAVLSRLPRAEQLRFDRYLGAAAEAALDHALQRGSFQELAAVARCYPCTIAGRRAARLTARQLFDSGRITEAAELWRSLLTGSLADEETLHDRLQAALAAELAGDVNLAALTKLPPDTVIALHAEHRSASDWMTAATADGATTAATFHAAAHWLTPAGAPTGRRIDTGSPPFHIPVWAAFTGKPAAEDCDRAATRPLPLLASVASFPKGDAPQAALAQWRQARLDDGEPLTGAVAPLVVGGAVILRDMAGILARDLTSGRPTWRHVCRSNLDGRPRAAAADDSTTPVSPAGVENALLATLTSDGERVYFIDDVQEVEFGSREDVDPTASVPGESAALVLANRLTALTLAAVDAVADSPSPTLAWSIGGPTSASGAAGTLAGHFFLGPPLPVGDLLLVLTESRGQVHLAGLDPATGGLCFLQGLALVDRPVALDSDRLRLAFLPAVQDGLAVCPTPSGALVAFDLAARSLAWTAQYRALETSITTSWRGDGRATAALYPVQPLLTHDHVLFLPPDSVELTAFQLRDGIRSWSQPRRGGHQLLTTVTSQLLLIGADRITSCDVASGRKLWERSLDTVCGRGILLGHWLLIPLQNGRLLALDAANGQPPSDGPEILAAIDALQRATDPLMVSNADSRPAAAITEVQAGPLGNLAVAGPWIISTSPLVTAAYMQAAPLLEASAQSELHTPRTPLDAVIRDLSPAERALCIAELHLTLGRGSEALPHLQTLAAPGDANLAATSVRRRAAHLLRELLYSQLETGTAPDPAASLTQLASLADSPLEAARWKAAALRTAAAAGDLDRWSMAATELAQLPPEILIPADIARTLQLTPAVLLRRSRRELVAHLSPEHHAALAEHAAGAWNDLSTSGTVADLQQFIHIASGSREADRARLKLSRSLEDAGERLAAEHWLLQIERSEESFLGGRKQRQLTHLARQPRTGPAPQRSLIAPAEWLLAPRSGESGRSHATAEIALTAFRLDAAPRLLTGATRTDVAVHPRHDDGPVFDTDLAALLDYRRELHSEPTSRLRLINLGEPRLPTVRLTDAPSGEADAAPQVELAIVRRDTAAVTGRLLVPARCREPQIHFQPDRGHFLPLADHAVHGISLLDGRKLWTVAPVDDDRSELVRLGPSGPGYCIVQSVDGVSCLDPLTGSVRWQRRDVSSDAGLYAHEEAGLFGDERVLAILEPDQCACRVVATDTGELLAAAQLPTSDVRRPRLVCGTRLFVIADEEPHPLVRVWDAVSRSVVYEAAAHIPVRYGRIDRRHVAFVAGTGEVVVLNLLSGEEVLRHPLDTELLKTLAGFSVWSDLGFWYVQTSHSGLPAGGGRTEHVAGDVTLPAVTVNGLLSAYDRRDNRRLWTRSLESRTVLLEPTRPLPFLVTLWRTREGLAASTGGLTLELLDKQTGHVLSQTPHIERTRFVHSSGNDVSGEYDLHGESIRISIRYQTPEAQPIITAEHNAELLTP